MTSRLYSDDELAALRPVPKRVTNPGARWAVKPGHRQRNYRVAAEGPEVHFIVYLRQSLLDENEFSCGIAYRPHIHIATESATEAGRKPESKAVETDRFATLNGALRCLIDDYHLSGIARPGMDHPRLMP